MEDRPPEPAKPSEAGGHRSWLNGEFLADLFKRFIPSETPTQNRAGDKAVPTIGKLAEMSYIEDQAPQTFQVDAPTNIALETAALQGGEIKRQRQEAQLRQQVAGLKLEVPDVQTGQQQISHEQEAFNPHLFEQPFVPSTSGAESNKISPPTSPEDRLHTIRKAQFKELAITNPEDKPSEIKEVVQEAAELNIPIEDMYERRHERKDENADVTSTTEIATEQSSNDQGTKISVPEETRMPYQELVQINLAHPRQLPVATKTRSMYKQAMLAGFWTGVAAMVIIVIMLVVSR